MAGGRQKGKEVTRRYHLAWPASLAPWLMVTITVAITLAASAAPSALSPLDGQANRSGRSMLPSHLGFKLNEEARAERVKRQELRKVEVREE